MLCQLGVCAKLGINMETSQEGGPPGYLRGRGAELAQIGKEAGQEFKVIPGHSASWRPG